MNPAKHSTGQWAYFDVDGTLLKFHGYTAKQKRRHGLVLRNGQVAVPHKRHIEELKNHHARGHVVVVWSAGGYTWAKEVVDFLGLASYVDLIACKPDWWYDDWNSDKVLTKSSHVFLEDDEIDSYEILE